MKRFTSAIAFAIIVAVATSAAADTHKGPEGSDTEIYVPKGWPVAAETKGSEAILLAADPEDHAALLYVLVQAQNVDGALKAVDGIVGMLVKDVTVKKGKAVKVNGMKGLALSGAGTAIDDGKAVTLNLIAVQPNDGHVLFAVAMVETDVKAKYAGELKKALAGLRKTK